MAYTDRQNRIFSKIAYWDLPKLKFYRDHGDNSPIPLYKLLSNDQIKTLKEDYQISPLELRKWKIADTCDLNDATGFYACVIETGEHEAAVAFRGTEFNDMDMHDILDADLGLITEVETGQHRSVDVFLGTRKELLKKYNLTMTGHSLGGNLAQYATLVSHRYGLDTCIEECVSLDGPGFSAAFIADHLEDIARMQDRMRCYRWSTVGSLMHDIPGATYIYIEVASNTLGERHKLEYASVMDGQSFKTRDSFIYIEGVVQLASMGLDIIMMFPRACMLLICSSVVNAYAWIKNAGRGKAIIEANENVEIYLDTEQFHELAQKSIGLSEKLGAIAEKLATEQDVTVDTVKLPGNVCKILSNLISAIDKLRTAIQTFVAWASGTSINLKKCATTLKNVSNYLEETATDFETIEKSAKETIVRWSTWDRVLSGLPEFMDKAVFHFHMQEIIESITDRNS